MSEPDSVQDGEQAIKPWPLHERVAKVLKASSPFGLLVTWAIVIPLLVFLMSSFEFANRPPDVCTGLGFGCRPGPLATTIIASFYAVVPGVIAFSVLLMLMSLFKASLRTKLWTAGIGPPLSFIVMAILV